MQALLPGARELALPRARCRAYRSAACAPRCSAQTPQPAPSRRALLSHAALAASLAGVPQPVLARAAGAGAATESELARLFAASELPWPGPSFAYQRQLYYAPWLFGEWDASSRLTDFAAPRGQRFVPANAAAAADADAQAGAVPFRCRFYSTLPDTGANSLRVALGAMPQSAIIADRGYNIKSLTEATLGRPGAIESVDYDPRDAPDRVTVTYAGSPPYRAELYLSALRADDPASPSSASVFHTAECIRQVSVGVRRETVNDYQILCQFQRSEADANTVLLRQRVAVYLSPYDALYFEAPNTAVGIYSYDIALTRVLRTDGAACVETPKDVVQCV